MGFPLKCWTSKQEPLVVCEWNGAMWFWDFGICILVTLESSWTFWKHILEVSTPFQTKCIIVLDFYRNHQAPRNITRRVHRHPFGLEANLHWFTLQRWTKKKKRLYSNFCRKLSSKVLSLSSLVNMVVVVAMHRTLGGKSKMKCGTSSRGTESKMEKFKCSTNNFQSANE